MLCGQSGTESIIILAASLTVLLAFVLLSASFLSDMGRQSVENDVRTSVDSLADAADFVYAQGEGANATVLVKLPLRPQNQGGECDSGSFIGVPPIGGAASTYNIYNVITFNLNGNSISATTTAPVTGAFPCEGGPQQMLVVSRGSFVSIGRFPVDVAPRRISLVLHRGDSQQVPLQFAFLQSQMPSNTTFSGVNVSIVPSWDYSDSSVSFDTASFSMGGSSSASTVYASINTTSASGGIYNSQAQAYVYANYSGNENYLIESFPIPITLEVN